MENLKIRTVRLEDMNAILAMNENALPHVNELPKEKFEWFREHTHYFLVADSNGDIAGFMVVLGPGTSYPSLNYRYFCEHYDDFDYVDRIVVSEHFRRKAVGSALYRHLFEQSPTPVITCEVNILPPNPVSVEFHRQLGFEEVAQQDTEGGRKRVSLLIRGIK